MDLRTTEQRMTEEFQASKSTSEISFNFAVVPEDFDFDSISEILTTILGDEPFEIRHNVDMFDILVETGVFKSRGDAKKNWKKTDQFIEDGCSSFLVGGKKFPLFIWKAVICR